MTEALIVIYCIGATVGLIVAVAKEVAAEQMLAVTLAWPLALMIAIARGLIDIWEAR